MLGGVGLERNSLHVFHHEVRKAPGSNCPAVELGDVGMIKRRKDALLLPEMLDEFLCPEPLLDELDRHLAAEVGIVSEVDFAHPAFAKQRNDSVFSEHLAGD